MTNFGEPGHLLSTGVRGKKCLVPSSTTIVSEDHDVHHVGSLTPSVYLECDVPSAPTSSFLRGQVHVFLNDTVFEPSSPMRHAAATVKLIRDQENHCQIQRWWNGPKKYR